MALTKEERNRKQREYARKPEEKAKAKLRSQTSEYKAKRKEQRDRPENKAKAKLRSQNPEYKAKVKLRSQTPEYKAKRKESRSRPEEKAKAKLGNQKPERKAKAKGKREDKRLKVLQVYSKRLSNSDIPCCNCCGLNTHIQFLSLDHISGRKSMDTESELKKLGYSWKFAGDRLVKWLLDNNFPKGFQILCHNCNSAKGFYGKCPHERK